MPKLSSLLLKIPDEFKPFAALGIGALILVCLVLFHGVSLHRILVLHRRAEAFLRSGRPHVWTAEMLFAWSVFLMLALHLIEIMTWAFALVHMGLILRPCRLNLLLRQRLHHAGLRDGRPGNELAEYQPDHRHLRPVYLCLDDQFASRHGGFAYPATGAIRCRTNRREGDASGRS